MKLDDLRGWNYIVYLLLKYNIRNQVFDLKELYKFEEFFKSVYPNNNTIKDKLRQTLQNLRDKGYLKFIERGKYQLLEVTDWLTIEEENTQELVYLLSNESIPGWVKIGRTKQIETRLIDLYNTSVTLPFKEEYLIPTTTFNESYKLEKSIHEIIDTINPDLRKNTEAYKREFFKLTVDDAKKIFDLVVKINSVTIIDSIRQ